MAVMFRTNVELLKQLHQSIRTLQCGEPIDFDTTVEKALGFDHLPRGLKSHIHGLAYERGHSSGYAEVLSEYWDILDTVEATIRSFERE